MSAECQGKMLQRERNPWSLGLTFYALTFFSNRETCFSCKILLLLLLLIIFYLIKNNIVVWFLVILYCYQGFLQAVECNPLIVYLELNQFELATLLLHRKYFQAVPLIPSSHEETLRVAWNINTSIAVLFPLITQQCETRWIVSHWESFASFLLRHPINSRWGE